MRHFFLAACAALALAGLIASAGAQPRLPPEGFADLAETLTPAVVNIATRQRVEGADALPRFPRGSPLERFNRRLDEGSARVTSLGSGFIISPDGEVVTNNHVIEAADSIEIILQNGETYEAEVLGRDPATDIALLRIVGAAPLPFVPMGDSDEARVGDLVLAIGNPFGLGGSVSVGIVSARNRNIAAGRYDDFIQTDAAINRGNSGGPLFSIDGEVIGVNTAIVSPSGESVGVGFATPTSIVGPVIAQLRSYGETRRGWLGVRLSNIGPEDAARAGLEDRNGAVVTRITPGGPAADAGLRSGDVIRAFAGQAVADSHALTRMVGDAEIGQSIAIDIIRAGRRMTLNAAIARLEEPSPRPQPSARSGQAPELRRDGGPRGGRIFGLSLSELDAGLRAYFQIEPDARGLVVMSVDPSSDAVGRFQAGDVIDRIGGMDIDSMDGVRAAASHERALVVRLNREGALSYRVLRPAPARRF
jgi:serine protease Do